MGTEVRRCVCRRASPITLAVVLVPSPGDTILFDLKFPFLLIFQCPQCGKKFKHKDIINLYAQEVAIPNSELEKVRLVALLFLFVCLQMLLVVN